MKSIHVDLRVGQSMKVGGATITLEEKSGRLARLLVVAPPGTDVVPPVRKVGAEQAKMGALV